MLKLIKLGVSVFGLFEFFSYHFILYIVFPRELQIQSNSSIVYSGGEGGTVTSFRVS